MKENWVSIHFEMSGEESNNDDLDDLLKDELKNNKVAKFLETNGYEYTDRDFDDEEATATFTRKEK